jgi:hypothetical protein
VAVLQPKEETGLCLGRRDAVALRIAVDDASPAATELHCLRFWSKTLVKIYSISSSLYLS